VATVTYTKETQRHIRAMRYCRREDKTGDGQIRERLFMAETKAPKRWHEKNMEAEKSQPPYRNSCRM